jgi:hypothetical protein
MPHATTELNVSVGWNGRNVATAEELKAIPRIGDAYSEKTIQAGRMSGKTSLCRRRFFHERLMNRLSIKLSGSRNEFLKLICGAMNLTRGRQWYL